MQTSVVRRGIIRQSFRIREDDMWNITKRIVGVIIMLLMSYVIITELLATPSNTAVFLLMATGILLMVIGIFSNIRRHSRISIGAVNRAEFYGAIVTMVGYMIYMNTRIDQIMLQLMK